MEQAVLLLSGGLESATLLKQLEGEGKKVLCLTFEYGQKNIQEVRVARELAMHLRHFIVEIDSGVFSSSALIRKDIKVKRGRTDEDRKEVGNTYVPARNLLFLSYALSLAESEGIEEIAIGISRPSSVGYPDCYPDFLKTFEIVGGLATKRGREGKRIKVSAPFQDMSKREVIELGLGLGVDYGKTFSCFDPIEFKSCGSCDTCQVRLEAFKKVGVKDPLEYYGK